MIRRFFILSACVLAMVCIAEDQTIYWVDQCMEALDDAASAAETASANLGGVEDEKDYLAMQMAGWMLSNQSDPNYPTIASWYINLSQMRTGMVRDELEDAIADVEYARGLLANMSTNNFAKIVQLLTRVDYNISNIVIQVASMSNYIDKATHFLDYYSNRVAVVEHIKSYECEQAISGAFSFLTNVNVEVDWINSQALYDLVSDMTPYDEPIMKQILKQDPDGENIDLTNEGYFLFKNYMQNERDFYLKLNMQNLLEDILHSTNNVDLSSITNYLYNIQQPFYSSFNVLMNRLSVFSNLNPFSGGTAGTPLYHATNFLSRAGRFLDDMPISRDAVYRNYVHAYSNIFQRMEIQLMALNGMFASESPFDEVTEGRTESGLAYDSEILTNAFDNVGASFGSTSNGFAAVRQSLNNLVSALDFREYKYQGDQYLTFSPGVDFAGFEVPDLEIDFQDNDDLYGIAEVAHNFTSVLWYLSFGIAGALGLFFYFRVVSKLIVSILTLISTLLSK